MIFVSIALLILSVFAAPASTLTQQEKDKVLFMIFENQNKKISHPSATSCKKTSPQDWSCANPQVKNYLMTLYRLKSAVPFLLKTDLHCDPITAELQKTIEGQPETVYGSLEFRREIKQSLKGQWLCRFLAWQQFQGPLEPFDDKKGFTTTAEGLQRSRSELLFIMNRDKTRIVSRKFTALQLPSADFPQI